MSETIVRRERGPILQLVAPALRPAPASMHHLLVVDAVNERWRLGRVLYDMSDGLEASISLYHGDEPTRADLVARATAALSEMSTELRNSGLGDDVSSASLPATLVRVIDDLDRAVPEAPSGSTMLDVEGALVNLRLTFTRKDEGRRLVLRLVEPNGHDFTIEIYKLERRFLCLRARHSVQQAIEDNLETRARLQRLTRRLWIGSLIIAPDLGYVYHLATIALVWVTRVDAELLSWLIDHAGAAISEIANERQFAGDKG